MFIINSLYNFYNWIINIFTFFVIVLMLLIFLIISDLYLYNTIKSVDFIVLFLILL